MEYSSFCYDGLIKQLEYEGFTHEEAVYGADHCSLDGSSQAVETAKAYLRYSSCSYDGLVEQLEYEGFSHEDAVYAVDNCGADWKEPVSYTHLCWSRRMRRAGCAAIPGRISTRRSRAENREKSKKYVFCAGMGRRFWRNCWISRFFFG